MAGLTFKEPIIIPPRSGAAFVVRKGENIKVINAEGGQIGDFICFNLHNFRERLSTGETVNFNTVAGGDGSIYLTTGKKIYSNAQVAMFVIKEDLAKGVHDLLYAPCSSAMYAAHQNAPNHINCRDNLTKAVEPYGLDYLDIPDPINLFQNTRPRPDGTIDYKRAGAKAGEYIAMEALVDALVAISTCPFDTEIKGEVPNTCTSLRVEWSYS